MLNILKAFRCIYMRIWLSLRLFVHVSVFNLTYHVCLIHIAARYFVIEGMMLQRV
jgi:hypothetical protein